MEIVRDIENIDVSKNKTETTPDNKPEKSTQEQVVSQKTDETDSGYILVYSVPSMASRIDGLGCLSPIFI